MRKALVTSLALALAACGGPLLGAEIQEQKVCIKKPTTAIQGLCSTASSAVPASAGTVDCTSDPVALLAGPAGATILSNIPPQVDRTDTIPVKDNIAGLDKKGTTGSIQLTSFNVTGPKEIVGQLDSFELDLTLPGDTKPFTFTYNKSAGDCSDPAAATCTLTVKVDARAVTAQDLQSMSNGSITYHVQLKGNGAQALVGLWRDWDASMETCMSAKLTVDALELIKNQ